VDHVLTAVDHLYRAGFRMVDGWKWSSLWVCKWTNGTNIVRGHGPTLDSSIESAARAAGLRGFIAW